MGRTLSSDIFFIEISNQSFKAEFIIIHAGTGVMQVNSFFSVLNIPPVRHKLIAQKQTEVGHALESVAKESTKDSLEEEHRLSIE
jgi:ribosomal silencing factor RsfS